MAKQKEIGVFGTSAIMARVTLNTVALTAANIQNLAEAGLVESEHFKVSRAKENLTDAGYDVTSTEAASYLEDLVASKLQTKTSHEGRMSVSDRLASFKLAQD